MSELVNIKPSWDSEEPWLDGTPICTGDDCPAFDGKRCRIMGCDEHACFPAIRIIVRIYGVGRSAAVLKTTEFEIED